MAPLAAPRIEYDWLRGFVATVECGSLKLAAGRLRISPVSMTENLRRLEELLGQQLMTRSKRGVALTPHGAWLLARARSLLETHDAILAAFRDRTRVGQIRLGVPQDYVAPWLARILRDFAEACPDMAVEVIAGDPAALGAQVREGSLDLALVCAPERDACEELSRSLWSGPLAWMGSRWHDAHRMAPLPLAVGGPGCVWRRSAIAALDALGMPWRIAAVSTAATGGLVLAEAGLAVTPVLPIGLPAGLRRLGPEDGLPRLPDFSLHLLVGAPTEAVRGMAACISAVFRHSTETGHDFGAVFGVRG